MIHMCKELYYESFNLNPSPAWSDSSLGHHFDDQKLKTNNCGKLDEVREELVGTN